MFRLALVAAMSVAGFASAQPTHRVKLNGQTFTLPEGFTIELAAGADLAPRPIACDFDEKGRLYVTDSSGSNEKVAVQLEKKPHRIVRLEDTNGDGTFDKQTVFVKNVMFPEGCMWLNGSLYVAAPPHILKFTDTNDDGVADKEEVWLDAKTLTGCANDLHGPYRGPDGYVYWCKGAFAEQEYALPNGKQFKTRASHIFRQHPAGGRVEPVMTGGMDNPVDLVFTPGGDVIFSTTFFQHPRDGKRDGLIHAVYGGVYGKDHNVVYDHPWTSPQLLPPMTHMGPAAPCGLHRLESGQFGKEYANNVFCCQFNMRKVSRHVLVPKGSTYETKDSDFVVSDNIDFHPTDVIEDADGSLLIVDTGGWYKLCCPTSQLVKPDVTGAIYRVRKVGSHKVEDPRGLKTDWRAKAADMAKLLEDPRPAVVQRAIESDAWRKADGGEALAAALRHKSARVRLNAVWVAARDVRAIPEIGRGAFDLAEDDEDVAAAALHVAALHRTERALPEWRLFGDNTRLRRLAATALGRRGLADSVPVVLNALDGEAKDRVLDHALTYALIEIGDAKGTATGLTHKSPRVRRAVLAALENIPNGGLEAKTVLAEVDANDAALRETAWWVAGRHPQWGEHLAGYFKDRLKTADGMKPEERDELTDRLAKFAGSEAIQSVLGAALSDSKLAALRVGEGPRVVLRAMARSGLKALPAAWVPGVTSALCSHDEEVIAAAIGVIRAVPVSAAQIDEILRLGRPTIGRKWSDEVNLAFLAAHPPGAVKLDRAKAEVLAKALRRDQPSGLRSVAADLGVRGGWSDDGLVSLAAALKTVNPMELSKLLAAFDKSKDEKVGLALVKALRDPAVRPAVRVEMVKPILDKYPAPVRAEAEKLYAELAEARKGETAKLEKLLADLKPGDVRRGQLVFNSQKANCIACHKMGYVGGLVGPDLTKIGGIRTERDLLEAIVFPSASFVRSYEPVRVVTTDERTLNGILKKDAPDEVVVAVAADKEERVARADVASVTPSSVSLMPSGLDQQLTPQDLADLVAFLRASK